MIIRLRKPRIHSANTTRPAATARTSCPLALRMNKPFQLKPLSLRGVPKWLISSLR
jgi:hypothetical protein